MKPETPTVLFIGAAHVDRLGRAAATVAIGKSNPGRFSSQAGGASLNVASNFEALGGNAHLCSIVGTDAGADFVENVCRGRGIKSNFVRATKTPTATYTSIVQPDGDLVVALADMEIYEAFDAEAAFAGLKTHAFSAICLDANLPEGELLKIAEQTNVPLAGLTVSAAKAERLKPALPHLHYLFTNRAEACALLQSNGEPEDMLTELAHLGPTVVVISDGGGSVWYRDDNTQGQYTPSPLSKIQDVTGGGDALAAGALLKLLEGEDIASAVEFGVRAAQRVLETTGPWREDLAEAVETSN